MSTFISKAKEIRKLIWELDSFSCSLHSLKMDSKESTSGSHLDSLRWLHYRSPGFLVSGDNVKVITEPKDFYSILKDRMNKAQNRITLSSLYMGTGHLEQQLITTMLTSARDGSRDVKIRILLDHTRSSRGAINSRTVLLPLLKDPRAGPRCQIALFHTPDLRGILKSILPDKWNETIGLCHMKIYLIDNDVIMSGANLNHEYFTHRQDRYILFENCPALADYLDSLVGTVSSFSLQLNQDNTTATHPDSPIHPFEGDYNEFVREAQGRLLRFFQLGSSPQQDLSGKKLLNNNDKTFDPFTIFSKSFTSDSVNVPAHSQASSNWVSSAGDSASASTNRGSGKLDTWIFPLIQMGCFNITQDEKVVNTFLQRTLPGSRVFMASGYFNLIDSYINGILNSPATYMIYLASPKANSFYKARGLIGAIPDMYTELAKRFFEKTHERVKMVEYERPGWTFHAKGLWYYLPEEKLPHLTLIGSPNFGYRSVYRDLEIELAVVTTNKKLREALKEEHERYVESCTQITPSTFKRPDRQVSYWVKWALPVLRQFF